MQRYDLIIVSIIVIFRTKDPVSYSSILNLQRSNLFEFFSLSPFLLSLAGKGFRFAAGKKKPIGTDARPLTDNPTYGYFHRRTANGLAIQFWRVACGRRARDYSRIRHRRSLEISLCVYVCVCVEWIMNRGKRNRSVIEEVKKRESDHRGPSSRFEGDSI